MPHLSLMKVKSPLVARSYRAQPIGLPITPPKSALGAGFDGRDQPWPLHPHPPSGELAFILIRATPGHRCCPFSFSSLRLEHREITVHHPHQMDLPL
jgi:hypothetical protein